MAVHLIKGDPLTDDIEKEILALRQLVVHFGQGVDDQADGGLDRRVLNDPVFGTVPIGRPIGELFSDLERGHAGDTN